MALGSDGRTDSALRLDVHFHVLALDGVYVLDKGTGRLDFCALGTPTGAEVADMVRRRWRKSV